MPDCIAALSNQQKPINGSVRVYRSAAAAIALTFLASCQSTQTVHSNPQNLLPTQEPTFSVRKTTSDNADWSNWSESMQPLFAEARILVEHHTGVDLSSVVLNIANDRSITAEVSHHRRLLDKAVVRKRALVALH